MIFQVNHIISFILSFSLIICKFGCVQAVEEEKKFIVAISEELPRGPGTDPIFRCYGTVISHQHIVTTADCVTLESQNRLFVDVQSVQDDGSGFLRFGSTLGELLMNHTCVEMS